MLARFIFGLAFSLALIALLWSEGCAAKHAQPAKPMYFRNCAVTEKSPDGKVIGCECSNPQTIWDAKLKAEVIYCNGKIEKQKEIQK